MGKRQDSIFRARRLTLMFLCVCMLTLCLLVRPVAAQDEEPCPYQPEQMLKIAQIFEKNNRLDLAMLYCLWLRDEYPQSPQVNSANAIFKSLRLRTLDPQIARRLLAVAKRFEERRRWHSAGFAYWRILKDYPDTHYAKQAQEKLQAIRNEHLRFEIVPLERGETLLFTGTKTRKTKDGQEERLFDFTCAGAKFSMRMGENIFGFIISGYNEDTGELTLRFQDQKELIVPIDYKKVILARHRGKLCDSIRKIRLDWFGYMDEITLRDGYSCYGIITDEADKHVDIDMLISNHGTEPVRFARNRIGSITRGSLNVKPRRTERFFDVGSTGIGRLENRIDVFVSHDETEKAAVILEEIFRTDERLWLVSGRKTMRNLIHRQESKGLLDVVKNSADAFYSEGKLHIACEKYFKLLNSDASKQVIDQIQKRVDLIQANPIFRLNLSDPRVVTLPLSFDKFLKKDGNESTTFLIDYQKITYQKSLNDEIDQYQIKQFVNRSPEKPDQEKEQLKTKHSDPRLVFEPKDKAQFVITKGQGPKLDDNVAPFLLFDFKTGRYFPAFLITDYLTTTAGQTWRGLISFVSNGLSVLSLESKEFGLRKTFRTEEIKHRQLNSEPYTGTGDINAFEWDTFTTIRPLITKTQTGVSDKIQQITSKKPKSFYRQSIDKSKLTFFILIGFFVLAILGFAGIFAMKFKATIMRSINHARYAHRRAIVRTRVNETISYRIYDSSLLTRMHGKKPSDSVEETQKKIQELEVKEAALMDISTRGARISTYEKIGKGKVLGLIIGDGKGGTVEIFGSIANIRQENAGTYHLGLFFLQEKTESKILLLRQCINKMNIIDIDI